MDTQKIGAFLATLRKERNLTQEALSEKIGVTNKTVSRWENGNYLPPVEMLQILSEFYDVSINEILSGERLSSEEYKQKAEDNIVTALHNSTATLPEKVHTLRSKWRREHLPELIVEIIIVFAVLILGAIFENRLLDLGALIALGFAWWLNSRMNNYVYRNLYDERFNNSNKDLE